MVISAKLLEVKELDELDCLGISRERRPAMHLMVKEVGTSHFDARYDCISLAVFDGWREAAECLEVGTTYDFVVLAFRYPMQAGLNLMVFAGVQLTVTASEDIKMLAEKR